MSLLLRPVCWAIGHREFYVRRVFPTMPYEEKDLYFNWYLLCGRCRRLVDADGSKYERPDDASPSFQMDAAEGKK